MQHGNSQDRSQKNKLRKEEFASIGVGAGLDYGGIGLRLAVPLQKHVACFAAAGLFGFSLGSKIRLTPDKEFTPTFSAMYGLNSIIYAPGPFSSFRIYNGASFGIGCEFRGNPRRNNFWQFGFIIPIRPDKYYADLNTFNNNGYNLSEPSPLQFTVGYHLAISR